MKRLALFSLLAFSLLIGNFGVAPVIASFSSDTTQVSRGQEVEWETYHKHKHGWSINYPPDWEVEEILRTRIEDIEAIFDELGIPYIVIGKVTLTTEEIAALPSKQRELIAKYNTLNANILVKREISKGDVSDFL